MAAFFAEYGLFLLKAITIVVAIVVVIVVAASAGRKASHEGLEVENLNKKYKTLANTLRDAVSEGTQEGGQGCKKGVVRPAAQFRHRFQR
jgi:serine protease SohB